MSEQEAESLPSRLFAAFAQLLITTWVGGMWMVGYIVVPTLFAMLDDRMLAGHIAGRLFSVVASIGFGASVFLLCHMVVRQRAVALRRTLFWVVAAMLVCVMAGYILQMEMAVLKEGVGAMDLMESTQRGQFAALHGAASMVYLVQSMLGVWVVVRRRRTECHVKCTYSTAN